MAHLARQRFGKPSYPFMNTSTFIGLLQRKAVQDQRNLHDMCKTPGENWMGWKESFRLSYILSSEMMTTAHPGNGSFKQDLKARKCNGRTADMILNRVIAKSLPIKNLT